MRRIDGSLWIASWSLFVRRMFCEGDWVMFWRSSSLIFGIGECIFYSRRGCIGRRTRLIFALVWMIQTAFLLEVFGVDHFTNRTVWLIIADSRIRNPSRFTISTGCDTRKAETVGFILRNTLVRRIGEEVGLITEWCTVFRFAKVAGILAQWIWKMFILTICRTWDAILKTVQSWRRNLVCRQLKLITCGDWVVTCRF